MEPLGPLRMDAIFSDLTRELDKNRTTLAKKGHDMALSAVANKTVTLTAASNAICKNWYQSECINTPSRQ